VLQRQLESAHVAVGPVQPIVLSWLLPVDDQPQSPREWEQWLAAARKTITEIAVREPSTPDEAAPRLIHAHCHGQRNAGRGKRPTLLSAREPSGLA